MLDNFENYKHRLPPEGEYDTTRWWKPLISPDGLENIPFRIKFKDYPTAHHPERYVEAMN